MTGPRVLIVEDDAELRNLLDRGLREEGFETDAVATGVELLRRVEREAPDLLVVDIGLPDADGRDLCPVLFLTARDALPDRLSGFEAGGDDYVAKPFVFAELAARLQALARRTGADGVVEAAGLRLDPVTHAVSCGRSSTSLTPTEFRLLARLLGRPGEAMRRRDLVRAGWPHGAIVHDNTLDAYVARLRRRLRELDDAPAITTIHGVGYAIQ
jgi:DNA-binding response OmpR family regulator